MQGVPGVRHREVQLVTTRADTGQTINSGFFKLSLNYEGYNDFLPEKPSRTPPLAWNAEASDVKAALEGFGNIGVVEVRRWGPDAQGGFTWKVTLDWERFVRRGNLPMLVVSEDALGVTWSAGGRPVVVTEERRGTTGPTVCYTGVCEHRVGGLNPFTQYQFRVRAHNSVGWSAAAGASKVVRTLQSAPPVTPSAPTLASKSATSITVRVPAVPPAPPGTPLVTSVGVQYQQASNTQGSWTAVPVQPAGVSTVTISDLKSSTGFVVRCTTPFVSLFVCCTGANCPHTTQVSLSSPHVQCGGRRTLEWRKRRHHNRSSAAGTAQTSASELGVCDAPERVAGVGSPPSGGKRPPSHDLPGAVPHQP